MAVPHIDTSRLPLLIVTLDGPCTDEEHRRYLRQLAHIAAENAPHVCLVHATTNDGLTPSQRQAQAAWLKEHRAMLERNCAGNVFVFPSALQRFMLTSILLVARLPFPHKVCGTFEEAEQWAREALAAARPTARR